MTAEHESLWWQGGVIYQIYPRSFFDTTGNGVGDLNGVVEKIDYLSKILGIDAIWLSPFYPSPMADFGYDVKDYENVDPLFGDLETFDRLIAQAHKWDLKVIIDIVPNHTSDQHPWFLESRSSRHNAKRDWYVWRDAKQDSSPPNNWLSVFGGSAWEWDENTKQYFLHSFLKEQPDLNWRNPEVIEAIFDVVRFWLDRGVDGFRVDVAHFIMKDPALRDNPLNLSSSANLHKSMGAYDSQIHINDQGHPDVHEVYRQLRRLIDSYNDQQPRFSVGEIHIYDLNDWVSYYGKELDELHMPYNFGLLKTSWDAKSIQKLVDDLESQLPQGAWPNYVLGNHDESRIASRLGVKSARLAAMLLLTLRGTPTIYYGDEIGMKDVPIPPERQQDPWGINVPGLGRDPCRTPMQWSPDSNAGFSHADKEELWLPLSDNYEEDNVEQQLSDPNSILNLYRKLLSYRRNNPALQTGTYHPIKDVPEDCYVYTRRIEEARQIIVALNYSTEERILQLRSQGKGHVALSTYLDRIGNEQLNGLLLRGQEGILIELPFEV